MLDAVTYDTEIYKSFFVTLGDLRIVVVVGSDVAVRCIYVEIVVEVLMIMRGLVWLQSHIPYANMVILE